jgi:alanine-glyoxylate transaminase/serine-glyoxylate transaminase/serine-pyruvate transaminase
MSLGNGLGKLAGRVFRIGHLGAFNDLMLAGTLAGVEMGLSLANVPHNHGGVEAAMKFMMQPVTTEQEGGELALASA